MNFWGYSTINYFSPMTRYSSSGIRNCGREAINEFKFLVREAHKRGIEVQPLADIRFCSLTILASLLILSTLTGNHGCSL